MRSHHFYLSARHEPGSIVFWVNVINKFMALTITFWEKSACSLSATSPKEGAPVKDYYRASVIKARAQGIICLNRVRAENVEVSIWRKSLIINDGNPFIFDRLFPIHFQNRCKLDLESLALRQRLAFRRLTHSHPRLRKMEHASLSNSSTSYRSSKSRAKSRAKSRFF
jgi:hypothetical protein